MNIIEILWKLNYDIISISRTCECEVRARSNNSKNNDNVTSKIKVGKVEFNNYGDLFVEFIDVYNGEYFDEYRYSR